MSENEQETAYSKLTNTAVPYKDRWKDKTYRNEFARWQREQKGLKRRPTKNPDGTWYKDTHPECRIPKTYQRSKIWHCDTCGIDMLEGYRFRHEKSKPHTLRLELNITPPPTPPPTPVPTPPPVPVSAPVQVAPKVFDKIQRNHNNLASMYRGIIQNAQPI